jgi:hypothetical protein
VVTVTVVSQFGFVSSPLFDASFHPLRLLLVSFSPDLSSPIAIASTIRVCRVLV